MIDDLLALDPGARGVASFFVRGGALDAARALLESKRVLITTGFALGPGMPETDGPPGAACLGRALRLTGKHVAYVTDAVTVPPLEAALKTLGEPIEILTFQADPNGAAALAQRLLDEQGPTHMVAIERPGRTRDGDYRSARGESVQAWNEPLDELFLALSPARPVLRTGRRGYGPRSPDRRHIVTIGVGDGGNEIGMGTIYARLIRSGALTRSNASVVRTDHVVVAGTSNWGAYGIVAALSGLVERPLLHSGDEERRMIAACVAAGAVDGITRRREPTVDGLPLEAHVGMLELLRLSSGLVGGGSAARARSTKRRSPARRVSWTKRRGSRRRRG